MTISSLSNLLTSSTTNATGSNQASSGQFININALVQMAVNGYQTKLNQLQGQQSSYQTDISNLGSFKSYLSNVQDSYNKVASAISSYTYTNQPQGLTFNSSKSGQYQLGVSQLAQRQITTINTAFGTNSLGMSGTLSLQLGTYGSGTFNSNSSVSINVNSTDSLSDIANSINGANAGIQASIIQGQNGAYLALSSSQSGANNAFQIVANDSGSTGLNQLNLNLSQPTNFYNVSSAQDGLATINGVSISSSNNTFNSGSLNFTATQTFANTTVGVSQDTSAINSALQNFANAYNQANNNIKGLHLTDYALNTSLNSLREAFTQSNFNYDLSQLGLSFDKNGVMSFNIANVNTNNFAGALSANFTNNTSVQNVFNSYLESGGIVDTETQSDNSALTTLSNSISEQQSLISKQTQYYQSMYSQLDAQIATMNDQLNTVTALMSQFNNNGTNK